MKHLNNFDFLRFVAAVLVMLSHAFPLTTGDQMSEPLWRLTDQKTHFGQIGVGIFFVMSGYLITLSWVRTPELGRFLWARVLRIYPAYFVMLVLVAFGLGAAITTDINYWTDLSMWAWFKNLCLFRFHHWLPGVFVGQPFSQDANDSIWTLGWEFLCYLIIAALGIVGALKRQFVMMLSIASVLMYVCEPKLFEAFFFRFSMYFLIGSAFALHQDRITWRRDWMLIGILLVIASWFLAGPALVQAAMAVAGGYVVLYTARQTWAAKFAWFGDVSYGLYIYAWPVNKLVVYLAPQLVVWQVFLVTFSVTFMIALLSWHLVERPMLRLKDNVPFERYLKGRSPLNFTD